MENIKTLDTVALLKNHPEKGLNKGQVGTVVEKLDDDIFEIEFCDKKGATISLTSFHKEDLMLLHFEPIPA